MGFLECSLSLIAIAWSSDEEYFKDPEGGGPFILALVFGVPGFLIGGIIGGIAGTDKTIEVEGQTGSELKETLEYLRSKARIPDYQ